MSRTSLDDRLQTMKGSASHYLAQRAADGNPIRVGLVGVGQMGAGIVGQSLRVPGIAIAALADTKPERAVAALERIGSDPIVIEDVAAGTDAIASGRTAVTSQAEMVPSLPVDVVVDATGLPEMGAKIGLAAALAKTHLVTMNLEADVTIGRLLRGLFELSGKVYTIGAGDEPAVAMELVDFCRTIGLDVIAAGKGKNNPLRPAATQDELRAEAIAKRMNPRMLTEFVDGTKTMCEMTALANASGLPIEVPGMHGPQADLADLPLVFRPKAEGGILGRAGVTDYVQGDVAPGVFVVVYSDDPDVVANLDYLKVGPGPYWALTRPFHLANIEIPMSIVKAVRDNRPTLVGEHHMSEVGATTKRPLVPGEVLEGIGGDQVHGYSWPAAPFEERNLVPLGLTFGARVVKHVPAGSPLNLDDVELDESSVLLRAWRLQAHLDTLGLGVLTAPS